MLTVKKLAEMSQVDIEQIDTSTLVNINAIIIDRELPHEEKVLSFIDQIGNPYCFLSGDIPVRIRFATEGKPLSDCLINFFSQLKQK